MPRLYGATLPRRRQLPSVVYHLAEAENWPSIQRHGLLSACRLLDHLGMCGVARDVLEREHRPIRTVLPTGLVIRDQRPMPPRALERCLVGLAAPEWYALLNGKVFFWFDPARLNRQRRACSGFPQVVLKIDSTLLLRRYADRAALTPINSGNARRKPAPRSAATFVPYRVWSESGWRSEAEPLGARLRSPSHPPVELAIDESVPDVMNCILSIRRLAPHEYLPIELPAAGSILS